MLHRLSNVHYTLEERIMRMSVVYRLRVCKALMVISRDHALATPCDRSLRLLVSRFTTVHTLVLQRLIGLSSINKNALNPQLVT